MVDFGVDIVLIDVDLFDLGNLLEHEMLFQRQGRALENVLLKHPEPAGDFLLGQSFRPHFHNTPVHGPARLALEQFLRQIPVRRRRDMLHDLLPGRLPLEIFEPAIE